MTTAQHSPKKNANQYTAWKASDGKQIAKIAAEKKLELIDLWGQTRGHISNMCRAVGVTRKTFYTWLREDKDFNEAIQDAEWDLNDDVRDALIQKIADGSSTDIQFYLKRRHPDFKDKPIIAQQFNVGSEMKIEFITDED